MLVQPQFAALGMNDQALGIPVSVAPDFRPWFWLTLLFLAKERIVLGNRAVVVQAGNAVTLLAIVVGEVATGVEVGGFDTRRLFRSIRLREDGHLAISRDGLPIVEAYLITRWHMYYLVYFHRVSVLTQTYITRALQRARTLYLKNQISLSSPLQSILIDEALTPHNYMQLTDAPIMTALFEWSNHHDSQLSTLAKRVSSRSEFHRRITGHPLKIGMARKLMPKLKTIISEAGYQPEADLILARTQKRGYFPYEGGILLEDGTDVRERSKIIKALESKIDEVMIFVPPECVDLCVSLIDAEIAQSL